MSFSCTKTRNYVIQEHAETMGNLTSGQSTLIHKPLRNSSERSCQSNDSGYDSLCPPNHQSAFATESKIQETSTRCKSIKQNNAKSEKREVTSKLEKSGVTSKPEKAENTSKHEKAGVASEHEKSGVMLKSEKAEVNSKPEKAGVTVIPEKAEVKSKPEVTTKSGKAEFIITRQNKQRSCIEEKIAGRYVEKLENIEATLKSLRNIEQTSTEDELVGKYVEKENLTAGFLTREGGTLNIGSRVSLYIPPDALPETGVYLIFVYLLPSESRPNGLKEGETWLTPIVNCGPSGTQFRKNVFLSVHMSNRVSPTQRYRLNPSAHCGNQNGEHEEWTILDSKPIVGNDRVIFEVNHFTRFVASGNAEALEDSEEPVVTKWIKAAAFVKKGDQPVLRVWLCDVQYFENLLEEECVSRLDSNPTPSLKIDNAGSDIVVRLVKEKADENEAKIQHIDSSTVWKDGKASVQFEMEGTITQDIFVEIFQENVPAAKILITPFANVELSRIHEHKQMENSEEVMFLRQQPDLTPSIHSRCFISDHSFREVCVILEGMGRIAMINKGWQALAEKCGITRHTIVTCIEMRARYQQRSPAAIVLDHFFRKYRWNSTLDALRHLSNLFLNMDNHDAKRIIDEEIRTMMLVNYRSAFANSLHSDNYRALHTDDQHSNYVPSSRYFVDQDNVPGRCIQSTKRQFANMSLPLETAHNDPVSADHGDTLKNSSQETAKQGCTCFGWYLRLILGRSSTQRVQESSAAEVRKHNPIESTPSNDSHESGYASNLGSPATPAYPTEYLL